MSVGKNQIGAVRPALRKTCKSCKHAIHEAGGCRMNIVTNPGPHPDTIRCFCKKPVPMKDNRGSKRQLDVAA